MDSLVLQPDEFQKSPGNGQRRGAVLVIENLELAGDGLSLRPETRLADAATITGGANV